MIVEYKLREVSVYALPAIRYAVVPKAMTDREKLDLIVFNASKRYGVSIEMMKSKVRKREYVYPRHAALYACQQKVNQNGGMSLCEIGKHFDNRDHTTVMYACQMMRNYMDTNAGKKADILEFLDNCLL